MNRRKSACALACRPTAGSSSRITTGGSRCSYSENAARNEKNHWNPAECWLKGSESECRLSQMRSFISSKHRLLPMLRCYGALRDVGLHAEFWVLRPVLIHVFGEDVRDVLKLALPALVVRVEHVLLLGAAEHEERARGRVGVIELVVLQDVAESSRYRAACCSRRSRRTLGMRGSATAQCIVKVVLLPIGRLSADCALVNSL